MTYCGGILVREGLVMFADTRTNAGVDNISTFRKLHVFKDPKKRVMSIATAGNLSISQSVISILIEGYDNPETGERETLMNAPTMFQAAQRVGHVIRSVHSAEGKALEASDVSFDVSFLFGGQIMGERMRLFMIYSAGNFIECTTDTPYLQIGEHKYGKPVLDRAVSYENGSLRRAQGRIGLDRFDHALQPLSVGMPIDLMVMRRDTCDAELIYRIEPGEPYFTDLRERWSAALRAAHIAIPRPPYSNKTIVSRRFGAFHDCSKQIEKFVLRHINCSVRFQTRAVTLNAVHNDGKRIAIFLVLMSKRLDRDTLG